METRNINLAEFSKDWEFIETKAQEIFEVSPSNNRCSYRGFWLYPQDMGKGNFIIRYEDDYGMDEIEIPTSLLWETKEGIVEYWKLRKLEREMKAKEEAEKNRREAEEARKQKELAEYLRLKAQFENT